MFPTYGTTQFGEHLPRNEGIYGTLSNTQTISHTITSLCMCLLSLIDHCNAAILQTFIDPFTHMESQTVMMCCCKDTMKAVYTVFK